MKKALKTWNSNASQTKRYSRCFYSFLVGTPENIFNYLKMFSSQIISLFAFGLEEETMDATQNKNDLWYFLCHPIILTFAPWQDCCQCGKESKTIQIRADGPPNKMYIIKSSGLVPFCCQPINVGSKTKTKAPPASEKNCFTANALWLWININK